MARFEEDEEKNLFFKFLILLHKLVLILPLVK